MYLEFYDPAKKVNCLTASFVAGPIDYTIKPKFIALCCLLHPTSVVQSGLEPSKSLKRLLLKREGPQCHTPDSTQIPAEETG